MNKIFCISLLISTLLFACLSVFGESKMKGFSANIDQLTVNNENYRQVIYTGKHLQLVIMTLKPGEEIGEEVHSKIDQFFRVESGSGFVLINGNKTDIRDDDAILIPGGAIHNVVNNGKVPLKFYTLYGPPEHQDGTIHMSKRDEGDSAEHFDGKTTE
jgi:mannose-6-phosphate isomerase-like protein (cupin superfamily)